MNRPTLIVLAVVVVGLAALWFYTEHSKPKATTTGGGGVNPTPRAGGGESLVRGLGAIPNSVTSFIGGIF